MRMIGVSLLNFLMFITILKISLIFVPFDKDLTLDSWIVGPSAMGSEKGIPISIISIPFLIIVLSIQTKLGIKVNILVDRALEAWNGESVKESFEDKKKVKKHVPKHNPSQADHLDDNNVQGNMFPPAPVATTQQSSTDSYDHMMPGNNQMMMNAGPVAANGMIGGNFGASF